MRVLVSLLTLAGLFVSVRALQVHNMDPGLAPPCAVSEHWDCGFINHSKYSVFPAETFDDPPGKKHVPVALVGVIGYSLMFLVAALGWWRAELVLALGGFCTACYLSSLEMKMEKWCIYCVWSQTLVTAILLATIIALVLQRKAKTA